MHVSSVRFVRDASAALGDEALQRALGKFKGNATGARREAVARIGDFEALRERVRAVRDHAIANWDRLLNEFEVNAGEAGSTVHWASTEDDAREIVARIARDAGCRKVVKSKSMITEEIRLNESLERQGISVVETDLGEYIVQLDRDRPSHIIAPVIHKTREQISALFAEKHGTPPKADAESLTREARAVLRPHFLDADMGLSGANFLAADTGSAVLVTNEGNGRLVSTLPRVHVTVAGIDKVIPSLRDLPDLLAALTASATGQRISTYVSVTTGRRRDGDAGGPAEHHVVLVDAGRGALLGTAYQEMLRCIRCGACMNHCPVYQKIGGHPYNSPYPGPMGSVLTPLLGGLRDNADLPYAATFCGACEVVCPAKIPLPDLMRKLREDLSERRIRPGRVERALMALWGWSALHPWAYSLWNRVAARALRLLRSRDGFVRRLPGAKGWFAHRDMRAATDGRPFLGSRKRK